MGHPQPPKEPVVKLAALITFLLSTTLMASAEGTEGPDVSGVTDVVIIGDAGSTILTTNGSEPFRASLSQRRSEWVSRVSWLWSDDDCPNESTLRVEGTTLRVTVASGAGQSCHVIFEANLPEGGSVSFDQPAAEVDMKGTYGKISLKSSASDFRFAGTAQGLSAVCDALKV